MRGSSYRFSIALFFIPLWGVMFSMRRLVFRRAFSRRSQLLVLIVPLSFRVLPYNLDSSLLCQDVVFDCFCSACDLSPFPPSLHDWIGFSRLHIDPPDVGDACRVRRGSGGGFLSETVFLSTLLLSGPFPSPLPHPSPTFELVLFSWSVRLVFPIQDTFA